MIVDSGRDEALNSLRSGDADGDRQLLMGAREGLVRRPTSMMPLYMTILAFALGVGMTCYSRAAESGIRESRAYFDVLDMHGSPTSVRDRSFNIFFDEGAWQGYSLPPKGDETTGFIGPFVHSWSSGRWAGKRFAELSVRSSHDVRPMVLRQVSSHSAPGYLVRSFAAGGIKVRETLFFADSWSVLVRVSLTSTVGQSVNVAIRGSTMKGVATDHVVDGDAVVQRLGKSGWELVTRLQAPNETKKEVRASGREYRIALGRPLRLRAHRTKVIYVVQSLLTDASAARVPPINFGTAWKRNRERWANYLKVAKAAHLRGLPEDLARRVVVKSMETLLGNWRAPRGNLHHAGVIPSYSNPDFDGFWAWDSWKHAAALALFAPQLARAQVQAMFDHQAPNGMIPDCIFLHKEADNWRNSKPPLATWAVLRIYQATRDRSFLNKLYPKLVRYHDWWLKERDHAHDGLAEYGSSDGTTTAAKWESGMDNAARFDHIRMMKNGKGAWSMDQESVDLNAYLYRDAVGLAKMAGILGKLREQARWMKSAASMKAKIRSRFFDAKRGYFFDVKLANGRPVTTYGPEGWIPLWAGAASEQEANAVAHVIRNPRKFGTFMPFPSLAADDPRFSPVSGYWRGPVWLDQAYFGVEGLVRYGHDDLARRLALRLVLHAKGLTGNAPIYENYDPLTGAGYQSRNFSWSAASYILLLLGHGAHAGMEPSRVPAGRVIR